MIMVTSGRISDQLHEHEGPWKIGSGAELFLLAAAYTLRKNKERQMHYGRFSRLYID